MAVIRHRHCLGKALGLVINTARADGVDVAPVVLRLRVHLRIAVDFTGAGQQEARAFGHRQAQRIVGAKAADFQRLNRQLQVVNWTCRAGKV